MKLIKTGLIILSLHFLFVISVSAADTAIYLSAKSGNLMIRKESGEKIKLDELLRYLAQTWKNEPKSVLSVLFTDDVKFGDLMNVFLLTGKTDFSTTLILHWNPVTKKAFQINWSPAVNWPHGQSKELSTSR